MRGLRLIGALLCIAVCEVAALSAAPAEDAPMIVAGPPRGIDRFEKAARKCGLAGLERVAGAKGEHRIIIKGVPTEPPDDHPLYCALAWIFNHPDADLYIVGNAESG